MTLDPRALLAHPGLYEFVQRALGASAVRRRLSREFFQVAAGGHVLDVGCGPGTSVDMFPADIHYTGIDISEAYVEAARAAHGSTGRHTFVVADVTTNAFSPAMFPQRFDLVACVGVLHHLPDEGVRTLLANVRELLVPGGRFFSMDPVRLSPQRRIARFLVDRDRGEFVRSPEAYKALISGFLPTARFEVRHDQLTVPYDHFLVEARRE
jgi:SAM-dependent methyltransferase